MNEPRLDLLPVFIAVADAQSFSLAGTRLGIAKSSVSRSVAELEATLGVSLFSRSTRHVALNAAGQALYSRIKEPLVSLQEVLGTLPEQQEEPSGRLRITAAVDFGAAVLAELGARFCARYPRIELDFHLSNDMVDLVAEGFDVALRISAKPLRDSALKVRRLGALALGLYASPAYLTRMGTPRTPKELEGHEWVCFRQMKKLELADRSNKSPNVTLAPQGRLYCDEMFFAEGAAQAGHGIATLPVFLGEPSHGNSTLVRLLPRYEVASGDVYLLSQGSAARKVTAFKEFVEESLSGMLSLR